MKNDPDIAKLEYVLRESDNVSLAGKTQAYSYMRNGYNRTADTVLYEKEIGENSYYVVQAIPNTKAKTLYIVSAFIGPKGYKKGASQLIDVKNPNATSKNGSVVTPTSSIPDSTEIVNTSDEKIQFSHSDNDIVTMTRGEARKRDARYKSDKVYSKGEAASTIASLNVLQNLPSKVRKQFTEELWYALNSELSDDKRKFRASLIAKRIMNSLYENAYSPDDMARIRKLESEIRALRRRIEIMKLQETRDKLTEEIKNSFMSYVIKRKIA